MVFVSVTTFDINKLLSQICVQIQKYDTISFVLECFIVLVSWQLEPINSVL